MKAYLPPALCTNRIWDPIHEHTNGSILVFLAFQILFFVFEKNKLLFEKISHEKNTKPKKLDDDHQRVEVKMPTAAAAGALLGYSSRSEGWIIRSFADIGR